MVKLNLMSTQTTKKELKKWIDQVEDQAILEGVQSLKRSMEKTVSWQSLPDVVKAGIKAGREDVKAGRVVSNEDFWKEYEHRL